jgi:hypothetical protein
MDLEEAIAKLDLIASDAFEGGDANEFRQLAEWLKELKAYREGCKCESCIHSEIAYDEYPCYLCADSRLWKFNGGKR